MFLLWLLGVSCLEISASESHNDEQLTLGVRCEDSKN